MEHNLSSEVVLKRRLSSIQELCFDLIIVIVFIVIIGDLLRFQGLTREEVLKGVHWSICPSVQLI